MNRREMLEKIFLLLLLGGTLFIYGCEKKEKSLEFGNQEKLWNLINAQENIEEPIDLAYSKETPAFYRDSSFGKADPSFSPKVSGG